MNIRINKFLSQSGVGSRRRIEEMLWNGQFSVNGVKAIPGQMIDSEKDIVTQDGQKIEMNINKIYFLLNKPLNVVSTTSDEMDRKTVMELIPNTGERLYPVGRLDQNSTGLLILTNDGDLALKLTHPRYHLPKTYVVTTEEAITNEQIEQLKSGVIIHEDKLTAPAEIIRRGTKTFEIILHQGMKRQIREMCKTVGLNVASLHRIKIGPIEIGNLKIGDYRELTEEEINLLLV